MPKYFRTTTPESRHRAAFVVFKPHADTNSTLPNLRSTRQPHKALGQLDHLHAPTPTTLDVEVTMPPPTKRTPQIEDKIIASVRNGAFPKHAAEAAGISKSAYHDWCNGTGDFGARVARARAEALNDGARIVSGNEDWRARAWWMERMDPEAFGDRSKLELSGNLTLESILAESLSDVSE